MDNLSKYSDEKLITLLQEGGEESGHAFDTIFNRYSNRLNAFCFFKAGNILEGEDIFEETWMKFLGAVREGKAVKNILPYLFAIAKNTAISRYRKENSKKSPDIQYMEFYELDKFEGSLNLSEEIEKEELISLIKIAVGNLSENLREAFALQWFGGLKHREIGEIAGISTASAKMRCHRAMKEVIKSLRPYFADLSS